MSLRRPAATARGKRALKKRYDGEAVEKVKAVLHFAFGERLLASCIADTLFTLCDRM